MLFVFIIVLVLDVMLVEFCRLGQGWLMNYMVQVIIHLGLDDNVLIKT